MGVPDFLGREHEVGELLSLVREAAGGHGGVVLLKGELGIGKTRLLRRLAALGRDEGALVSDGRWYDSQRMPAYVGFRESLAPLVEHERVQRCLERDNPYVPDIARLGPEFAAALDLTSDGADLADDAYRLWRGIELLLRGATAAGPVLLALDDLQWADQGSLELLGFLARDIGEVPLLIAGAYREDDVDAGHPLLRTIAALRGTGNLRQIELGGIGEHEAALLAEGIVGQKLNDEALRRLFALTQGNPLFLEEIVRHLLSRGVRLTGRYDAGSLEHDLPRGVRDVMARRLAVFSPECQYLLQLAACIGREFELSLLQRAGGLEQGQLVKVLQEATDASAVEEMATGRFSFAHPLMREVVYRSIPAPNRMAIHRDVATALESYHVADPSRHTREIASHLVSAGSLADPRRAVVYCTEGGRQARALLAFDEARWLAQGALDALDRLPCALPRLRAHLLMQLAYTGTVGGRPDEAIRLYQEALAIYEALGDCEGRTDAYRWVSTTQLHYARWAEALEASTAGLAQAREERTHAYVGLVGTHTFAVMLAGRLDEAARWSRKLLEMSFDDETRAIAHHTLAGQHSWGALDPSKAMGHFAESRRLFLARGGDSTASQVARDHAFAAYFLGKFDEAQDAFEESQRLARATGRVAVIADLCAFEALVSVHRGAWEKARSALAEWGTIHEELAGNTVYRQLAQRAIALEQFWRHGPAGVAELLCAAAPLRNEPIEALLLAEAGDERASGLVAAMRGAIPPDGRGLFWLASALPFVAAAVTLSDVEVLAWEKGIRRYEGGLFDWDLVDLELGRMAALREDWTQAGAHFERAACVCEAGGLAVFRSLVSFHHGLTLLKAGDRRAGSAMLEEAGVSFCELGLEYFAGKVSSVLARPARGRPLSKGPAGLTARELAVLRLAAEGRSTREIAAALVISERTAEHHLANAYAKVHADNRAGAIAWYVRQGLDAKSD